MTSQERSQEALNELAALASRLYTQAEAVAALVARLKLLASGEPGDPMVNAQLDRVIGLDRRHCVVRGSRRARALGDHRADDGDPQAST